MIWRLLPGASATFRQIRLEVLLNALKDHGRGIGLRHHNLRSLKRSQWR